MEERITVLMSMMTTEEKILQLHQEGNFNTADNLRLGIPGFLMADGPHGVREGTATSFPVGIGMASTWDRDLAWRIGEAMGKEFRGKGKHQALGPCLDIDRDPRNGRSPETGGEDPYLCAQITTAVVKGIQSTPCIATIKHYNANHRELYRTQNNIAASQRVLHDDAGLAFRTAVQEGGAFCVMNAYNQINSEKCAESTNLLTTILRKHWGFPYYVVSDWASIWSAERAVKAGCDICMGSDDYKNNLPALVASGDVQMSVLDAAVRRVLRTKILAGMLDYQPSGNPDDVNSQAHRMLCLEAARKSLVLLKNTGSLLPLNPAAVSKLAVIGPNAATARTDASGSSWVTPLNSVSPKQGLESRIGASKTAYVQGCDINSTDTSEFAGARAAAAGADAVIFVGGLDGAQEGEGFDRTGESIQLPGKQQDLINALAAVNPNIVVVIYSGGICGLNRSIDNIRGLIQAFYPGQESGTALAEILFGDVNPSGKLPVTMPVADLQLPAWLLNDNFDAGYGRGYRWFDKKGYVPQYPFGYGLSFTTFAYSNLRLSSPTVAPGVPVTVSVDVSNTGSRAGEEVVQLYVSDTASTFIMPLKQLRGFERVLLAPGETKTVTMTLTADELWFYNEATFKYDIEAGDFIIRVGGSSDRLPLIAVLTVSDGPRKPDLRITSVRTVPRYPFPGQEVIFLATVKNQGSAALPAGSSVTCTFTVDGQNVSWSDELTSSLPVGGMALLCGNRGANSVNTWTPAAVGAHTVAAVIDPGNVVDECVESNNTASVPLTVYPRPAANLALSRTATASSIEKPGTEASNAVDGNMGTRWSSGFSDPQSLTVDLGSVYHIDDVTIYWETAYGKSYSLQISTDGGVWTTAAQVVNGDGGIDRSAISANGRYVRMIGTQRGTEWGYSIYEFEVHGGPATGMERDRPEMVPHEFRLCGNYPNPFNPATTLTFTVTEPGRARLAVVDVLGRQVACLFDRQAEAGTTYREVFDASGLTSGIYIAVLESGGRRAAVRMLLIK